MSDDQNTAATASCRDMGAETIAARKGVTIEKAKQAIETTKGAGDGAEREADKLKEQATDGRNR